MILLLTFVAAATSQAPADASRLAFSAPLAIAELDAGRLKGEPSRLAWSPDGSELYVQIARRDRWGNVTLGHFTLAAAPGSKLREVDQEPAWASRYWSWKSSQSAPGSRETRIALESRDELVRSTAAPRGGDLARGSPGGSGGGPGAVRGSTVEEAMSASNQTQKVTTVTLRFKGEILGEWKNEPVVPGATFGWAPAHVGAIAFSNREGRIAVMNLEGHKQELRGYSSGRVYLPAWSEDGLRLAHVQEQRRNRFSILVTDISSP